MFGSARGKDAGLRNISFVVLRTADNESMTNENTPTPLEGDWTIVDEKTGEIFYKEEVRFDQIPVNRYEVEGLEAKSEESSLHGLYQVSSQTRKYPLKI